MSGENLSPAALRVLMKEVIGLRDKPPVEGVRILLNEDDITELQAEIVGPAETPYEGGVFKMKLVIGPEYPAAPPKGFFLTKIFHPNVSAKGDICVNVLKKDWKPDMGIAQVLLASLPPTLFTPIQTVKCLLIYPNPASALNEEAGKLLLEKYEDYQRRARLMTQIHAVPKKEEGESAASSDDKKVKEKKAKEKKRGLKRL